MDQPSSGYGASAVISYGFRGDPFLLYTVHNLIHQIGVSCFVETGSFYGATTSYMAQSYPQLTCYSCEPNQERFVAARSATAAFPNCHITHESSPQLLRRLAETAAVDAPTLFWLDAHGYGFDWPLREEVELITRHWRDPFIVIDDMRVPGRPWFGWDEYGPQECSYRYIQDILAHRPHQVWYPNYPATAVTSWPMRGWGLILFTPEKWTPDQWLIGRGAIEAAITEADRPAQESYWKEVLDQTEQLDSSRHPDDARDAWTRVAQQVPNWFVVEVARRLSADHNLHNGAAWTICIHRLASDGEVGQTVDLLSLLPPEIATQRFRTFAQALSPGLRATAIQYIAEHVPASSAILAVFHERTSNGR